MEEGGASSTGPRNRDAAATPANSVQPLAHLRVIDMSQVMAGPFCCMLLGDMGADVIKVEPPGAGDQTRKSMGFRMKGTDSPGFLALNRKVGGLDIDWNHTAARSKADHHALEVAYRTGQVLDPHAQATVPTIDLRGQDNEEIHLDIDSYVERARLDRALGGHPNQALWLELGEDAQDPAITAVAVNRLDDWLAAIEQDTSGRSRSAKVLANRPDSVVDSCWLLGQQITTWDTCRALFAHGTDPRIAAGGPLTDDVLKCRLSAPRRSSYDVAFTDAEWRQLNAIFRTGVCDYSLPGVGQQRSMPWSRFDN